MDIGTLVTAFGADLKELKAGQEKANRLLQDYSQKADRTQKNAAEGWGNVGKSVGNFAIKLAGVVGVALTVEQAFQALSAVVSSSLESFAALDQGLIAVQKTTNFTDEEMRKMEQSIIDMGREIPLAHDAMLEIASAAGQLGVTGVSNITKFTETMAKMQGATDLAGEEGAKSLARLLTTAGEGYDTIDRLGSVIVALGNNMAASESEIVRMASEVGRATAAFAVSSADAAAMGAALKSMGAQAELSGSAISRSMIEIQGAIEDGGKKLEWLSQVTGMTQKQLKDTFEKDATAVFTAWIQGMGNLKEQGVSTIKMLDMMGLSGQEAIKGLSPLISNTEVLTKALALADEEFKNNKALTDEARKAAESYNAQVQLMKNAITEVKMEIGRALAPTVVDMMKKVRDWVKENDKFIKQDLPKYVKLIAKSVKDAIDYIVKITKAFTTLYKESTLVRGVFDLLVHVIDQVTWSARKMWEAIKWVLDRIIALAEKLGVAKDETMKMKEALDSAAESTASYTDETSKSKEAVEEIATATSDYNEDVDDMRMAVQNATNDIMDNISKTQAWSAELDDAAYNVTKSKDGVLEFSDALISNKTTIENNSEAIEVNKNKAEALLGAQEKVVETNNDVVKSTDAITDSVKKAADSYEELVTAAQDMADEHKKIWDNMGTWTKPDGSKTNEIPIGDSTTWITGPEGRRAITLGIDTYEEFLQLSKDSDEYRKIKYGIDFSDTANQVPTPAADFDSWKSEWDKKWMPTAQASQAKEVNVHVQIGDTEIKDIIAKTVEEDARTQDAVRRL